MHFSSTGWLFIRYSESSKPKKSCILYLVLSDTGSFPYGPISRQTSSRSSRARRRFSISPKMASRALGGASFLCRLGIARSILSIAIAIGRALLFAERGVVSLDYPMWVIRVILKFNENEGINVMVLPVSPDCVRSIQVELPL